MPIRFRCAYCNQLMGIARRKAGAVVRCPSCSREVIVPAPEPEDSAAAPAARNQPLFERSDFEEMFNPAAAVNQAAVVPTEAVPPPEPAASPTAAGTAAEDALLSPGKQAGAAFDVEPVQIPPALLSPASRPGIVLSPTMATVLSVAIIVALAVFFAIGLLVGYLLRPAPRPDAERPGRETANALCVARDS